MRIPPSLYSLARCFVVLAAQATVCLGQTTTTGSISGRIVDADGTGLPGVIVELNNPAAATAPQSAITDIEGHYSFRLLPPSTEYVLKASIPGYATVVSGPLGLEAGRATVVDLTLQPASDLEETVTVEATGQVVDTTSTKVTAVYNSEFIAGLPLLGRRFQDVLTLAPGVTDPDNDGHPNVRGARDTGLQIRLDGTNITDPLSGYLGQDINLEAVEGMEVITGGAPAEYGRADGGFVNIITKSGGNETEGSFKVFFRSDFLDGDGAGNQDGNLQEIPLSLEFSDTRAFFTLGGAIRKDRLWYFGSAEFLDREEPILFIEGGGVLKAQDGIRAFGKLTLQADQDNKVSLQINHDPLETSANFVGARISPDSDFRLETGGTTVGVKWTSILSPRLLLETVISHLSAGQAIDPVSEHFRIITPEFETTTQGQIVARLPCLSTNCLQDESIFRVSQVSNGIRGLGPSVTSGPYSFKSDDSRERSTFRADLAYAIEEALGRHTVKSGFEFNLEKYSDTPVHNPILTDATTDSSQIPGPPLPPNIRFGSLFLEISDPVQTDLLSDGLNLGAYVQDSWRPLPSLTVNAGVRLDSEDLSAAGFADFDPVAETREIRRRYALLCDAIGSTCTTVTDPSRLGSGIGQTLVPVPPGHPVGQFDLDGDGYVDLSNTSPEYVNLTAPFTTTQERIPEGFRIVNRNLSPRLSVSWDPWNDGKTKVFGAWGVYYDRLDLGGVVTEQEPVTFTAEWVTNGPNQQAEPGDVSSPITDIVSINQVDRDLRTPRTTEWSLGVEREIAPEWSIALTYIRRSAKDLLQDFDINHISCEGFDVAFDISPYDVCGDGGTLELDRFGLPTQGSGPPDPNSQGPGSSFGLPNGAPDLYLLNPYWNQVFRLGNFNSSEFTATEISLRKRLHRNWQMYFAYTYSKAIGEAESFTSQQGNDPATSDKSRGYLNYDQRHVIKWQGVLQLPNALILGGTVQWASGTPYSRVAIVADQDDRGNLTPLRIFSLSGLKNDHRNGGQWTLNTRLEKEFQIGRTFLSGFVSAENLLELDDLQITQVTREAQAGRGAATSDTRFHQLGRVEVVDGTKRFGRRWEIGVAVKF